MLGLVASAAVVAMAGTAMACTETRGQITIRGKSVNGIPVSTGSATYVADGGDFELSASAGYCGGKPSGRVAMSSAVPGTLNFDLTVAPGTCGTTTRRLDAGAWQVRWVAAQPGQIDNSYPYPACHFVYGLPGVPNADGGVWAPLGAMQVDSNGDGSGTYSLTAAQAGPGNICLDNNTNYAPPVIPMTWSLI